MERSYERVRAKIASDLRDLMRERNINEAEMARCLGIPKRELRQRIYRRDLRISQLMAMCDVLGVDMYPLFRPQIAVGSSA